MDGWRSARIHYRPFCQLGLRLVHNPLFLFSLFYYVIRCVYENWIIKWFHHRKIQSLLYRGCYPQNGLRQRRRTCPNWHHPEVGSSQHGFGGSLQFGRSLHATAALAQETHRQCQQPSRGSWWQFCPFTFLRSGKMCVKDEEGSARIVFTVLYSKLDYKMEAEWERGVLVVDFCLGV